ncbi:hypothetical protein [Lentzea flava]|uniref:Uncharacterized protein n=1 Tax=Lentzea flava TaxID=103732 RepID=A0ABQ2UKJ5_9PSEU|nr:hypothetical protein [Lentzea flava]MCP2199501.1 hypothetical protein [Lentzea flava]GGU37622.1 hypothetical protein GCM10010178_32450 [Lentzea flava]
MIRKPTAAVLVLSAVPAALALLFCGTAQADDTPWGRKATVSSDDTPWGKAASDDTPWGRGITVATVATVADDDTPWG